MARLAFTYRAARRNSARKVRLIWRELPRYAESRPSPLSSPNADNSDGQVTVGVSIRAMLEAKKAA